MTNHAIIYSNGIADFRWEHVVEKGTTKTVNIPVRKEFLADVLCSLTIYGDVRLETQPTYRPNDNQRRILGFSTDNVMQSLAVVLSGAEISVELKAETVEGKLVGYQQEERASEHRPMSVSIWLVSTKSGIRRIPFSEVQSFQLSDPAIQTEVELALSNNVEQLKPNSTAVTLELSADETAEAVVQYTVPSAAWKISYRIIHDLETDTIDFLGFAIVDNNTDYDWDEFHLSVVTGEPITFSSDLDEIRTPRRGHVNLVRDRAIEAVEVESELPADEMPRGMELKKSSPSRGIRRRRKFVGMAAEEAEVFNMAAMSTAEVGEFSTEQTGDFSMFHSPTPVTIAANSSAMFQTFQVALDESKSVLYYDPKRNRDHPYRTVQFINSTDFSLGRGACTVYQNGAYAGSCVMPATKPGAESMLIHALDGGVKIDSLDQQRKQDFVSVKIDNGVVISSFKETITKRYRVANHHDQSQRLLIEHTPARTKKPSGLKVYARDNTSDGKPGDQRDELDYRLKGKNECRLQTDLAAKDEMFIEVIEEYKGSSSVRLIGKKPDDPVDWVWMEQNVFASNESVLKDPQIIACLDAQSKLSLKQEEIAGLEKDRKRLISRQERLRKNIKVGAEDAQSQKWRLQLDEAEENLVAIDELKLPKLNEQLKALSKSLYDALKAVTLTIED